MVDQIIAFITNWVAGVADVIPLGYAFGAGMISAVNPCGFAMLPAYLGLYMGTQTVTNATYGSSSGMAVLNGAPKQVARGLVVAGAMTAGFVLLFGSTGAVLSLAGQSVIQLVPWIAVAIGVVLVALGIWVLRGRQIGAGFAARLASRMGDPSQVGIKGFFVFGTAYATASLSCTMPIFLTVVGTSLAVEGLASAAFQFISYALGMGLVIGVLTLVIALFKGASVGRLRAISAYVERISGVFLVAAGIYIVYYWLFKGDLLF